jgi:predicted Zn-dependent peptidase
VKKWTRDDLRSFWKKWYFPANGTLFLVGDFEAAGGIPKAVQYIKDYFGRVQPLVDAEGKMVQRSPVRPPVVHQWGMGQLRKGVPTS